MIDHEKILDFISRFHGSEDVFLHGCCYWFAWILENRFLLVGFPNIPAIYYEPVEGHFVTKIENRFYDVRGDVSDLYRGKPMYNMDEMESNDPKMFANLMRDCRDFEEVEDDA